MKFFERLVMRHIKNLLPPSLDPRQFAQHPNRSTDDAMSTTLYLALTHLGNRDTYVRMLFIDFSSAFNTIIPQHLIENLSLLGPTPPSATGSWTSLLGDLSCDLSGDNNLEEITQHQSGSVLLPCSCSDLHTKPQKFIWETFRTGPLTEVLNDEHYRGRLQRFNNISPGNLSLLISDLREEDEGVYRCSTKKEYRDFQVYVKGTPPGVLRCGRPLVHGVGLFVWSQWKSSASEGSRMSAASTHERSSRPYPSQSMRYCSRDRTRLESRRARTWLLTGHSSPFRRVRQFEEGHMKGGTYAVRRREPKPIHHWIDLPDDLEQTDKLGTEFVAWQLEAEVTGG
ncbi:hypothetical protein QTP86_019102 [Hemibagrus guttatus]|nr:hypothetical protein QTP86_019102 [Hemibagrus guttatus]